MNPLPTHILDVYEDRKPLDHPALQTPIHNPPQYYQSADPSNLGQAGPSRIMANPGHNAGGMSGAEGEEGSWLSNHGMPWWMAAPRELPSRLTPWSMEKIAQLQVRLAKRLGPEYVATRPGPGGGPKLTYIEGWKVINLANEVFGFNGWSSEIRSINTDFLDTNANGRCSISVTAHIRITLADGTYHEDIGHGSGENLKGKASALEKAKKEAVTDAMKRALRSFGNVLGNCLYDKEYCKEVSKMRVVPPNFNPDDLERRPEFAPPPRPAVAAAPPLQAAAGPSRPIAQAQSIQPVSDVHNPQAGPSRVQREETPIRSIHDADMTIATTDENFDAEFMGEESFFEGMDMSVVDEAQAESKQAPKAPAVSANSAPVYQHRHRPDPVPPPQPPQVIGQQENTSGPSSRTSQEGGDSRSAGSRSSGGGVINENAPPAKPRGGFNYPAGNGNSNASANNAQAAAAARRRAISLALANGKNDTDTPEPETGAQATHQAHTNAAASSSRSAPATHTSAYTTPHRPVLHPHRTGPAAIPTGPIRAGSPSIPQGGIDSAAARAQAIYRAQAAKYDLEVPGAEAGMSVQGFSSARGIKRISEEMGASPTKDRGQGIGQQGQMRRIGPRQALGEIYPDDPGEAQKRHRVL